MEPVHTAPPGTPGSGNAPPDPGNAPPGKPPHVPNPDNAEHDPGMPVPRPADPKVWEGKHLVVNVTTNSVTAHDTPEAAADQAAANDRWLDRLETAKKNKSS